MTAGLAGDVPRYRRLHCSLRPARVAVLVPGGGDWMPTVLRIMEGFSRIWGGAGNILVPVLPGDVLSGCFWPVLARFDPDRLGYYQPTLRGAQMADAESFDAWVTGQAQQWVASHGGTFDEARRLLTEDRLMHEPTAEIVLSDDLQERIRARLAPFGHGEHLEEASFPADQPPGPHLVDLLALDANPRRLQVLRTEGLDPRVRLLLAARTGALAPGHASALVERGVTLEEVGIAEPDLPLLLELCWRRRIRPGGVTLRRAYAEAQGEELGLSAAYTDDGFLERTPLGDTMRGCGWFLPVQTLWRQRPFFVVCGDEAADFCLALALDRCYGDAAWFPQSFVHDDEVAAAARSTLALIVDGLRSAAGGRRPTVVTSATLPSSDVTEAARTLLPRAVGDDRVSIAEPARLRLGRPWRLLDREQFDRVSSEPFVASELAGELPLLRPSVARANNAWDCTWQVDVALDGYQLPARQALNGHLAPEQHLWTLLRSSTDGISYFSHTMGFVEGSSLEQALARPRLRLPDARGVFDALLAQAGLRGEDSSAGRYTQATLDLWGGLEPLAADLRRPSTSNLLHAYVRPEPKRQSSGQPGIFLEVQRRWFLSLQEAMLLAGTTGQETRTLLDALVGKRILRRGLILQCRRCSYAGWYRLEDLGQTFTCGRCQQASLIIQPAWKQPADGEPHWYYDLDEVVYQALKHDMRAPILALSKLAEGARSVLTRPEADVYRGARRVAEVDLWAVVDGAIVVGEAKTVDQLHADRTRERAAVRRLVEVAAAVTADEVILALLHSL